MSLFDLDKKVDKAKENIKSLEVAERTLQPFYDLLESAFKELKTFEVQNEEQHSALLNYVDKVKSLQKDFNKAEGDLIDRERTWVRSVQKRTKPFKDKINEIFDVAKLRSAEYMRRVQLEEARKQKEQEAKRKEAQKKLDAEAKKLGVEAPELPPAVAPEKKVWRSEKGGAVHVRKKWVGEIVDPDEVDRQYCSPDQKKIDLGVKGGVRMIKGVNVYEKEIAVYR